MTTKPIKAKPIFYSRCYEALKQIAQEMGYNLLIHGSMDRDMDLVAVAWIHEPKPHIEVLDAFSKYLGLSIHEIKDEDEKLCNLYYYSILPGNRSSYIINLNRGGKWTNNQDPQYYIDISFTPTKL